MSLGVIIKGPEGIVLAADSRVTLEAQRKDSPPIPVNYDNATKLLSFSNRREPNPHRYVGAVTYGQAVIGLRTAHSFVPEFEQTVLENKDRLKIEEYSSEISKFFIERWQETVKGEYQGPNMTFIVGGYDEGEAYGRVFRFEIPGEPKPRPETTLESGFGMTWGGQLEVASRLVHGFDPALVNIVVKKLNLSEEQGKELHHELITNLQYPIPYQVLPLQDCVDLAIFLIRTTMSAQQLAIAVRGVGGPIDVATITRTKGLNYVQQKQIHGEEYLVS